MPPSVKVARHFSFEGHVFICLNFPGQGLPQADCFWRVSFKTIPASSDKKVRKMQPFVSHWSLAKRWGSERGMAFGWGVPWGQREVSFVKICPG